MNNKWCLVILILVCVFIGVCVAGIVYLIGKNLYVTFPITAIIGSILAGVWAYAWERIANSKGWIK